MCPTLPMVNHHIHSIIQKVSNGKADKRMCGRCPRVYQVITHVRILNIQDTFKKIMSLKNFFCNYDTLEHDMKFSY